jgi:multiple sugar transport system permease protein
MLNEYSGWFNIFIQRVLGLDGVRWFTDPNVIYFTYTIMGFWGISTPMILFLAGLQNVPTELYDAAIVDGAGWWRRLVNVTIPMVSPVILQQLILAVIGVLQYFLLPFVLNAGNGEPQGSTRFPMVIFYRQAFNFQNMGYAAAIAWLIFVIAMGLTALVFSTSRNWVYYAGERE